MIPVYLHQHPDFPALLRILEDETGIQAALIDKDYWIMHVLYGLKISGFEFELKGGTSLSKGYKIIDRFSEDIDIHIKPPALFNINENPKNSNPKNVAARKDFYEWLAKTISIDGIKSVERDHAFDDKEYYRSGGIRLFYESRTSHIGGMKEGILLEAGFDTVTPNTSLIISSWAYERVIQSSSIDIINNTAIGIDCYHAGYTFVEKLQTIATKFRQQQTDGIIRNNLMRQYYDVYCLLGNNEIQNFIGTPEYEKHKQTRFPKADYELPVKLNEAFLLTSPKLRDAFRKRYEATQALYYNGQPNFDELLDRINANIDKL